MLVSSETVGNDRFIYHSILSVFISSSVPSYSFIEKHISVGTLFLVFNLQLTGLVSIGSLQNVSMNITLLTGKSLNMLYKSPQLTLYPSFRKSYGIIQVLRIMPILQKWRVSQ